jgi:hypothetical protein
MDDNIKNKIKDVIKYLKEKTINIIEEGTKKYNCKNYSFNPHINDIECYIALNLSEELSNISNNIEINEIIITNIVVGIKYMLNFLSKKNRIDSLEHNELNEILCNLIFDIIDDSTELFRLYF